MIMIPLLCERYENKRLLIPNNIRALFNLPTVTKENSTQMTGILDIVMQHSRALKMLGQPTEQWDSVLVLLISGKLDSATAREWEFEKIQENVPTLEEIKTFLRKKAVRHIKLKQD